eukprot:4312394-Alexandrium_andersonii.AAC.1
MNSFKKHGMNRTAWCVRCGAYCKAIQAHKHTAGSPCTDHSSFGKREAMAGKQAKVFVAWTMQRRQIREPIWGGNLKQFAKS